jgi:hypothetical protein
LPNWLHRKIGKKNVIQGLGCPFSRGKKLPQKKKKIRNIGIFANLKSSKSERSREKPKPRRIKRNVKRKKKVKEAFTDMMLCATS